MPSWRTAALLLSLIVLVPGRAPAGDPPAPPAPTAKPASFPEVERKLSALFARIDAVEAGLPGPARRQDKGWVKKKLRQMFDADQMARNGYADPEVAPWSAEARAAYRAGLGARIQTIDRANRAEMAALLEVYPWFRIGEFGEDGDRWAWALVQHADADVELQQRVLDRLAPLWPQGETSPANYAYLWDRVALNRGRKLRYGTQGHCVAGSWQPLEVEDPDGLEARRAAMGLETMAAYRERFRGPGVCP